MMSSCPSRLGKIWDTLTHPASKIWYPLTDRDWVPMQAKSGTDRLGAYAGWLGSYAQRLGVYAVTDRSSCKAQLVQAVAGLKIKPGYYLISLVLIKWMKPILKTDNHRLILHTETFQRDTGELRYYFTKSLTWNWKGMFEYGLINFRFKFLRTISWLVGISMKSSSMQNKPIDISFQET